MRAKLEELEALNANYARSVFAVAEFYNSLIQSGYPNTQSNGYGHNRPQSHILKISGIGGRLWAAFSHLLTLPTQAYKSYQLMVDVTGNNISNASDEFYSRQRVLVRPEKPLYFQDYNLGRWCECRDDLENPR